MKFTFTDAAKLGLFGHLPFPPYQQQLLAEAIRMDEKRDYLGEMIEAYDCELTKWHHERLNEGISTSTYTVSRGDKLLLHGDVIKTEDACERFSKRAAMRAAIRSLTGVTLEDMGIDEEDKIEMTDVTEVPHQEEKKELTLHIIVGPSWPDDVTQRLIRMEEKLDRILIGLWPEAKESTVTVECEKAA